MTAVVNTSFRRFTRLTALRLPFKVDSEVRFSDQDFQTNVPLLQDAVGMSPGTRPLQRLGNGKEATGAEGRTGTPTRDNHLSLLTGHQSLPDIAHSGNRYALNKSIK